MQRLITILWRVGIATSIMMILFYPLFWLEILIQRELYRLADQWGLLTGSPDNAMQILGLYITRSPEWVRFAVEFLAASFSMAMALWVALLVYRRMSFKYTLFMDWTVGNRVLRIIVITTVFSTTLFFTSRWLTWPLRNLVFEIGAFAGCEYNMISGQLLISTESGGPFNSYGYSSIFNYAYVWAPLVLVLIPPFFLSLTIYHLWIRSVTKGTTLCLNCGYDLMGNESGVCPECGKECQTILSAL